MDVADRIQKIGDDLNARIETIVAATEADRPRVTEDEFKQHYVPKQKFELQQAHNSAKRAYEECCRETALKIWKKYGDVTDSGTEYLFADPTNPIGYRRAAENLRKLAGLIPDGDSN